MEKIDPNDIIVLDESGSDLKQTSDYARARGGERAKASKPHHSSKRFSIIGAISIASIVAMMYIDQAVDGNVFLTFVQKFLLKELKPGKFVVMDNVKFHQQEIIKMLIESTGAKVVFLPPYSPDLSPIEKMWSKIKTIIKRYKPRSEEEFHNALFNAACAVNEDDLESWFEECGYAV